MNKRAHRVFGIELRAQDPVAVVDPVGKVTRHTLAYASYSAGQQAKIEGKAKRASGQASV